MPQPAIPIPTVLFELSKFLHELELDSVEVQAGVASVGEAAAYALVWELGNAVQTKPGLPANGRFAPNVFTLKTEAPDRTQRPRRRTT